MRTPDSSKKMFFLAIYKDSEKGYWTRFVDFPAADQGETIEDAVENSTKMLESIIHQYSVVCKKSLPDPLPLAEFKKSLDPSDGPVECIVPIFIYPPSPPVRIQITGKVHEFNKIDIYAKSKHLTRSELMIKATLDYIRNER